MTFTALALTAAALTAAGALFVCLLAVRRVTLGREEHRRRTAEERLRPLALALVAGEKANARVSSREAEALAELLARYSRHLSGDAQAHIAAFFDDHGLVEREAAGLSDRRAWRRARAAHALGNMGSKRAVWPLLAALADPSRDVRAAAARSLGRLCAVRAVKPLVGALVRGEVPRAVAGQALLTIGPSSLPDLRTLVEHPEPGVRTVATELIGLLGEPGDATLVSRRLRDTSAEVRAKATRALGRLGAEEAAADLRAALGDRIPFVRATAAIALGMIGDRDSAGALLTQARSDRFEPAHAAAHALARVDPAMLWEAARLPDCGAHLGEAADLTAVRR